MAPHPQHLMELSLVVRDLHLSRRFYEQILGLRTVLEEPGVVGLQLPDAAVLLLFQDDGQDQRGGVSSAPHLRFGVTADALHDWDRHLMMNGVVVESRVWQPDGCHSLYFRDPDEHSLEIASQSG